MVSFNFASIVIYITYINLYSQSYYLIIPMSTTYSPIPITGGRAIANDNPQIRYTHGNDKNVFLVVKCQDLSCFNTD